MNHSKFNNESTLILGSNGFLGSYFKSALPAATSFARNLREQGVTVGSLDDNQDIRDLLDQVKPKTVINCLAIADLELCESEQELAYWVNTDIPGELSRISNKNKFKLMHFSTDAVFSDIDFERKENSNVTPKSVYAKSKRQGEIKALENNPNSLVGRTNFFGLDSKSKNIFAYFARNFENSMTVKGYRDSIFTPVYVEDLIRMSLEALNLDLNGLYHMTGDSRISKADFGRKIARYFDLPADFVTPIEARTDPRWKIRTLDLSLNNSKLREKGIIPSNLEIGIKKAMSIWNSREREK